MTLVDRCTFRSPNVENPSYELRRHQSGKSFRTRREKGRSETFTFVRTDSDCEVNPGSRRPFWTTSEAPTNMDGKKGFQCLFCAKSFLEERSLRSHVLSKHADANDSRKKRRTGQEDVALPALSCSFCLIACNQERIFVSSQALEDHVRAKHTALHPATSPDRSSTLGCAREETGSSPVFESLPSSLKRCCFGSCDICGYEFHRTDDPANHQTIFLPANSADASPAGSVCTNRCQFCSKPFREKRAQLQHENNCAILCRK
jgi:hypothetical protein